MRERLRALVAWFWSFLLAAACAGRSISHDDGDAGAGATSTGGEPATGGAPATGGTRPGSAGEGSSTGGSAVGGRQGAGGSSGTGTGGVAGSAAGAGGANRGGDAGTSAGVSGAGDGGAGGEPEPECDPSRVVNREVRVTNQSDLEKHRGVFRITGDLIIELEVTSLEPLECLTSVGGTLWIGDPYELDALTHLERLEVVGRDLILEATLVPDVDAFRGLTSVGGDLQIIANLYLDDLGGFENLGRVGGDLTVSENDRLRPCEAARLRDDIGVENIDGAITISDNGGTGDCP